MIFRTRKLIKPEDLNSSNTLFGGRAMSFLDEEAAIYAMCQLDTKSIVTKLISEINFESPARQNDVIEIGVETISLGRTSITLRAEIRNKDTGRSICKIEKIVFVSVDSEGKPTPHGKTEPKE
jgi:acyl-CoA thioesterase YciA